MRRTIIIRLCYSLKWNYRENGVGLTNNIHYTNLHIVIHNNSFGSDHCIEKESQLLFGLALKREKLRLTNDMSILWTAISQLTPYPLCNSIGGVMVSMPSSSAVDRGFEPRSVKPSTLKLVFVASPLTMQL